MSGCARWPSAIIGGMDSYEAVVETADDGSLADAGRLVVELRNPRTGRRAQFSEVEFTVGRLLHLAR